MKFDIVTIFPRLVRAVLEEGEGVVGRAAAVGLIDVAVFDLRDATTDRHRVVDDTPFGGGPGMVMKPEPFFAMVERITAERGCPDALLLPSPQGTPLTHAVVERLSRLEHLVVLCGRYEGVDDRVRQGLGAEEVSVGDFVVSGGELPALLLVDAVARLVPGVVGDGQSVVEESFVRGRLDHPHYTRPAEFRGMRVPEVLLSGHHAAIRRWRKREALRATLERRPDLLAQAPLDEEERALVREILSETEKEQTS